mgnify:CR=1 FL=1
METAAVLLPLFGAFIAGCLAFASPADKVKRSRIDKAAQWVTCWSLILAAVAAGFVFRDVVFGHSPTTVQLFTWIDSGAMEVSWAIKADTLTAVMLFMVTTVSSLIHLYSIGYMRGNRERNQTRFYICFAIAIFGAMGVAMSANLFTLFVFYEVLTLSTYPLVAHKGDAAAKRTAIASIQCRVNIHSRR